MIKRWYHYISGIDKQTDGEYRDDLPEERTQPASMDLANTISSIVDAPGNEHGQIGTRHAPVLDIDFPVFVIPSSTPGHFHLYLEREMPWSDYQDLITVLAKCGIIEGGYAHASLERGATYVRRPDVEKPKPPNEPEAF